MKPVVVSTTEGYGKRCNGAVMTDTADSGASFHAGSEYSPKTDR